MIIEKTKLAFQKMFPAPEPQLPVSEETGEEAEQAETDTKAKPEKTVRLNGVIECDYAVNGYHLDVQVDTEQLLEAVNIVDQGEFFIESITGVDWIKEGQIEIIYDFSRYDFDTCRVVIRTRIDRTNPVVPTLTEIYAGANWHERETHDFFGIKFDGHPHLIPLLLPEDADFHPLLKDFKA